MDLRNRSLVNSLNGGERVVTSDRHIDLSPSFTSEMHRGVVINNNTQEGGRESQPGNSVPNASPCKHMPRFFYLCGGNHKYNLDFAVHAQSTHFLWSQLE